jgi:hypothetical protein
MATQLVSLPMHLVQALLGADLCDKWFPDSHGIPSVFFERVHLSRSETAIAVVVLDPGLVWDNWGRHGRYGVSTILITSERNPAREYLPRPLPDELLAPVFEAVVSATRGSLTGHDALELYSELDAAQRQPNALPLPPLTRQPRGRFERRLRESAIRLQSCFASELDELRSDINLYADALWRSGFGPAIGDLSTEGTLVDALSLQPSASEGCLESRGDFDSVVSLMNSVENARRLRDTTGWLLKELAPYGARPRQDLSAFHVTELYRRGFADRSPNYHAPLWRRTDSRYCEYPGTVHAAGIEAAMLRLAAAFDQQLLADVDPVVTDLVEQLDDISASNIPDWCVSPPCHEFSSQNPLRLLPAALRAVAGDVGLDDGGHRIGLLFRQCCLLGSLGDSRVVPLSYLAKDIAGEMAGLCEPHSWISAESISTKNAAEAVHRRP